MRPGLCSGAVRPRRVERGKAVKGGREPTYGLGRKTVTLGLTICSGKGPTDMGKEGGRWSTVWKDRPAHPRNLLLMLSDAVGLEHGAECGPHVGEAGVGQFLRNLES